MTPLPTPPVTTAAAHPDASVAHLTPGHWERANRLLLRKALAEFAHERLLSPEPESPGRFTVASDDGTVVYHFAARLLELDHWHVDADSLTRARAADGRELPLSALDFFSELRGALGLGDAVLPVYLEEITSTLSALCYKLTGPAPTAAELAGADFQTVESAMTEGHPCFVANSGRLGFASPEYLAYAPETARATRLIWIAAHRDRAALSVGEGLDEASLLAGELGGATLERFRGTLRAQGLDPADYLLIPVHPWQWWHRLSVTFASEVARRYLVPLGEGDDDYRPQQSIRTFFNASHPERHYVKTALSILNMGFLRGLSAAYMAATPQINDWVAGLVEGDPVLRASGLTILRERAAVGYRHLEFEGATDRYSPYRKMLAALWRESPVPRLGPGERVVTMAALLHTDRLGASLAGAFVARSGLSPEEWLRGYLDAYLTPLLHCFYAYDLVFMPHGENTILVLDERGAVLRAIFKDIAEEIAVLDPEAKLPPGVDRVVTDTPEELRLLSLFTDVFDCFLRFLSAILVTEGVMDADAFWRTVGDCARDYQRAHPEFKEKFLRYDLFAPTFALSCLNRLQLRDNRQMLDLSDPSGGLQLVGALKNPIA
ncbi:IucA/IucC family protein [Streptomyces sp. NPDC050560]|uniref:IucA/IucC family protein n=1 Tax=Streptomyces sp. NPDC050560 TaxID=3365630 RepID=UPI0037A101A6